MIRNEACAASAQTTELGFGVRRRAVWFLHSLSSLCCTCLSEECDDEDDPEYNFLADIDEPDLEDYRDDKAVRITSQYPPTPYPPRP